MERTRPPARPGSRRRRGADAGLPGPQRRRRTDRRDGHCDGRGPAHLRRGRRLLRPGRRVVRRRRPGRVEPVGRRGVPALRRAPRRHPAAAHGRRVGRHLPAAGRRRGGRRLAGVAVGRPPGPLPGVPAPPPRRAMGPGGPRQRHAGQQLVPCPGRLRRRRPGRRVGRLRGRELRRVPPLRAGRPVDGPDAPLDGRRGLPRARRPRAGPRKRGVGGMEPRAGALGAGQPSLPQRADLRERLPARQAVPGAAA